MNFTGTKNKTTKTSKRPALDFPAIELAPGKNTFQFNKLAIELLDTTHLFTLVGDASSNEMNIVTTTNEQPVENGSFIVEPYKLANNGSINRKTVRGLIIEAFDLDENDHNVLRVEPMESNEHCAAVNGTAQFNVVLVEETKKKEYLVLLDEYHTSLEERRANKEEKQEEVSTTV